MATWLVNQIGVWETKPRFSYFAAQNLRVHAGYGGLSLPYLAGIADTCNNLSKKAYL